MAILKITDLTNITPRHHIQHRSENERKQREQIRHPGPGDTTLAHPSSPPFSPSPSIPTRSVHIYKARKQGPLNMVRVCKSCFNPLEAIIWLHSDCSNGNQEYYDYKSVNHIMILRSHIKGVNLLNTNDIQRQTSTV